MLQHLSTMLNLPNVILTQKCWLKSDNMLKIDNFSLVYSSFGKSAMDEATSLGILIYVIILGGDFNSDLESKSKSSVLLYRLRNK